ncbi:MAG TPA: hypothetical protein VGU65_09420 [Frateuria sp.]|uniref:hypothetical protein n=1 Tax=Frateuria sp. TaxID=2211372 RepID=UPI002DE5D3B9|nr:hypothetical protein [Frateuria sp.]
MHKILPALIAGASVFAIPTFAQVIPGQSTTGAQGSTQASVSGTGMPSNTAVGANASTGTDASGNSTLGLGGLLRQTQGDSSATSVDEGAGPTGSLDTRTDAKARLKKARAAHGH